MMPDKVAFSLGPVHQRELRAFLGDVTLGCVEYFGAHGVLPSVAVCGLDLLPSFPLAALPVSDSATGLRFRFVPGRSVRFLGGSN